MPLNKTEWLLLSYMGTKKKYYLVLQGKKPGIYHTWAECQRQIKGYKGAQFKSYEDYNDAIAAQKSGLAQLDLESRIIGDSISVDAACEGNPGKMEYRGVYTATKEQIFLKGPYPNGTNNVGEFLALVHALAMLKNKGRTTMVIYSDSKTAMAWVKAKKSKTTLVRDHQNEILFQLIEKAELWLQNNRYENPILKWNTRAWGEIPADFGRK